MKFYIVDAFADKLFGGNPAGVVLIDEGMDFPQDEIMVKTAAELRYSETAFVKQTSDREFVIRYFTPEAEVDLCGHATIGSFCALKDMQKIIAGSTCKCVTKAGILNISVLERSVLMDMGTPKLLNKITDVNQLNELYGIMGIERERQGDVFDVPGLFLLPEMVSTGLPDIMMPVGSMQDLQNIRPDFEKLSKLSERYGVVGVHAFTLNAGDKKIHCRNFAPLYGINEEAATGTSNGALTYYLYRNNIINEGTKNTFIQGEAMGRPSRITSQLTVSDSHMRIQVGGEVVVLASGDIRI